MSVIVVGGGIAGLTAAYTLQKRGVAVQVLEREGTPGGRMRSEVHGDCIVDRGAQFIASSYGNMLALAGELGIAGCIEPLRHSRNGVLDRLHRRRRVRAHRRSCALAGFVAGQQAAPSPTPV